MRILVDILSFISSKEDYWLLFLVSYDKIIKKDSPGFYSRLRKVPIVRDTPTKLLWMPRIASIPGFDPQWGKSREDSLHRKNAGNLYYSQDILLIVS